MEGVTNYDVDKPSYAFSTSTTEFDDQLIRRGIVTFEQAMAGKGASPSEAKRLAAAQQAKQQNFSKSPNGNNKNNNDVHDDPDDYSDDDDDFEDDDDDEFLQRYRSQRLQQMKQEHAAATAATAANVSSSNGASSSSSSSSSRGKQLFGQVIPIQRPEWTHHVNDSSRDCYVVVTLTSPNQPILTGAVEDAIKVLAQQCPSIKFVSIPSTSAIPNWPDSNLPTMFIYRHGKMTQEIVQMNNNKQRGSSSSRINRIITPLQLLDILVSSGNIEFDPDEIENVKRYDMKTQQDRQYDLRRRMIMMKNFDDDDFDDEEDDDEVI